MCLLKLTLEMIVFLEGLCRLFMPCAIIVLLLLCVILLLCCVVVLLSAKFSLVVNLCLLFARSRFPHHCLQFGLKLKVKFVESSNFAFHLLHLNCLVYVGSKQGLLLVQLAL